MGNVFNEMLELREDQSKPIIVLEDPVAFSTAKKIDTKSSECISLPTEHEPNF